MRISGLSLVPVSVASVAVLFALSACGGGGGGGSTPGDTSQALRSAAQLLAIWTPPPITEISAARRASDTCPQTTELFDGFILDFGTGCNSPILGNVAGTVRIQLVSSGVFRYTFQNFRIRGFTLNGVWSDVEAPSNPGSPTILERGDIRYSRGGCEVRVVADLGILQNEARQVTGTLTTSRGSFPFTATYELSDTCTDWYESGSISISGGAASVNFVSCGTAQLSVGGQSETVNLNNLANSYNPCN